MSSSLGAKNAPRWSSISGSCSGPLAEEFGQRVRPRLLEELVGVAHRILGSEDLAWDAVQTVLIRLWNHGSLPEDLPGVLRFLVRKAALELLRAERRRQHAQALACPACGEDLESHPPFDEVCYGELQASIRSALDELPQDQARAVELCLIDGYEYATAARFEGVPLGTIRSRVHRGRRALQNRLQSELGGSQGA